jgi:hypothetical protein
MSVADLGEGDLPWAFAVRKHHSFPAPKPKRLNLTLQNELNQF